jgi:hypothetical protein
MKEILPGLYHWTAFHQGIRSDVSSYFVSKARALIDPMLPPSGLDAFRDGDEPRTIVLTNRHHYRGSGEFVAEFGCPVLCHESGLHEFEDGPEVEGFCFGDEVAPAIVALEMGAICPDDSVLRIDIGEGALAFADGLIHWGDGEIGFVPDGYMGDDPGSVKQGLRKSTGRLAEERFDSLLFAHGEPILEHGKPALHAFLDR